MSVRLSANVHEARLRAMGSDAHIVLVGGDPVLLDDARAHLELLEARWSRFRPSSELCRLDASPGRPVVVSRDTFAVIAHAVEAWRLTAGRFDPTVLPALRAAGYDRDFAAVIAADGSVSTALRGPMPAPGCAGIVLDATVSAVTLPEGVVLDLGGIGKGYAADRVATALVAAGAEGACVNLGGDLRVVGRSPPSAGDSSGNWRIDVDDPLHSGTGRLLLAEGGVATSSRLRRAWRRAGHGRAPSHRAGDRRERADGPRVGDHRRGRDVVGGGAREGRVRRRPGRRCRARRRCRRDGSVRARRRSGRRAARPRRVPRGPVTQKLVWYTIRASGIVTWLLVTASVLWGLLLASRSTRRPRPSWVLDLHRFIAALSFAFLAVHVGLLLVDSYVGFSPSALAVPFASHWRPAAVAWGILALYLLVVVELTSLVMSRISRRLWHAIHLGSFVVFGSATMHAVTAGTDAGNPVSQMFAVGSSAAVALLTVLRVVARARRRPRARLRLADSVLPTVALPPPTLRPIEDAIAEVRRGAARGGRVARRGYDRGRPFARRSSMSGRSSPSKPRVSSSSRSTSRSPIRARTRVCPTPTG